MKPTPPATWALVLGFTLIYLSWGTTYKAMAIGIGEEHLPPLLFGGSRTLLAGVILLVYQILQGKPIAFSWRELPGMFGVSCLLFVGGNGLMNAALAYVPSSVAAVLAATTPLWMGLFGIFGPKGDRLSLLGWLGLAVGLVGVILIYSERISQAETLFQDLTPLLAVGSALSWGIGSVILRRLRSSTNHITLAAYQMILGGTTLCLVALAVGEGERIPQPISARAWWTFAYLLIVGSLIGFVAFNWLLGHVAAAKVGTYAYVNPVIAILVAWGFGEKITWAILAGIGVILFGVFLVRSGSAFGARRREVEVSKVACELPSERKLPGIKSEPRP